MQNNDDDNNNNKNELQKQLEKDNTNGESMGNTAEGEDANNNNYNNDGDDAAGKFDDAEDDDNADMEIDRGGDTKAEAPTTTTTTTTTTTANEDAVVAALTTMNGSHPEEPPQDDKLKEEEGDVEMKDAGSDEKKEEPAAAVKTLETPPAAATTDSKPAAVSTAEATAAEATATADAPSAAVAAIPAAVKTETPTAPAPAAAGPANPNDPGNPVLKGTISYSEDQRKHFIRGNWTYEFANKDSMRFELTRSVPPEQDVTNVIQDGEFTGSFTLKFNYNQGGKAVSDSRIVKEKSVKLQFKENEQEKGRYVVSGTGVNEYGVFNIAGAAKPTEHNDGQYFIELKKLYDTVASAAVTAKQKGKKGKKKNKKPAVEEDPNVLPDPSPIFEKEVICLRGKVTKEASDDIIGVGAQATVTKISGMWGNGWNLIENDPQNTAGLLGKFELEHKSSSNPGVFPVSGRYTGFFVVIQPNGAKQNVQEKDVSLKFRKNNKGFWNVEGKGTNGYGKYTISGILDQDNAITIFRHYLPRKAGSKSRAVTSAPPPINEPSQSRRPSIVATPVTELSLDDVKIPEGELEPFKPPQNGLYAAVSRGILRINDDGSHGCQAKWALTREHLAENNSSDFTVRLEPHFVAEAIKRDPSREFPVDSDRYKGSFQMKKTGAGKRFITIVDDQVVMKFRMTGPGLYNVYGRGVNSIGIFELAGTLIANGKSAGQIELYRSYPPELLKPQPPPSRPKRDSFSVSSLPSSSMPGSFTAAPRPGGLVRRESTRTIKMPSRLEEDDPEAQLARLMDKCMNVLRLLRTKDAEFGSFFNKPVDPVALGIPTYFKVIKEPMDLNTLEAKMVAEDVKSPEEFARLARLIFENAMKFNEDPAHSVNASARQLLIFFNQKYDDIEKLAAKLRSKFDDGDKKKGKGDKKRKRGFLEEPKSLKRRRLDEARDIAASNAIAMSQLVSAAPMGSNTGVSRTEFNMLLGMVGKLQQQVVETFTLIADLSSDDPASGAAESAAKAAASQVVAPAPAEKKKPKKRAPKPIEKPAIIEDESVLTSEEQEFLANSIAELPEDAMEGAMQIIHEAAAITASDDEIDLELDALPPAAQRKLYKFVIKYIKPPKSIAQAAKKGKASNAKPKKLGGKRAAKAPSPTVQSPVASPMPAPAKPEANSFFSFGGNADSDSDDSEAGEISESNPGAAVAAAASQAPVGAKAFRLGGLGDDDDDDDDDSINENGAATNWNISAVETEADKKDGDEDDAWGAAREEALAAKAREEDKKKREEKLKAEAEQDKKQRMAEAVDVAEKKKAERLAKEAEEARLQEEKEKEAEEARQKARENAMKQVQSVEQTVDLDEERDLMKQLEQNYMDTEMGGASPSSDFGF